jgi:Malic enzyme, N-terminal domain
VTTTRCCSTGCWPCTWKKCCRSSTPTVARAIERYSHEYRRPRGVFLSVNHPEQVEESLRNYGLDDGSRMSDPPCDHRWTHLHHRPGQQRTGLPGLGLGVAVVRARRVNDAHDRRGHHCRTRPPDRHRRSLAASCRPADGLDRRRHRGGPGAIEQGLAAQPLTDPRAPNSPSKCGAPGLPTIRTDLTSRSPRAAAARPARPPDQQPLTATGWRRGGSERRASMALRRCASCPMKITFCPLL